MPATSGQVSTLRQFVGQGEIYLDVLNPATNAPMAFLALTGANSGKPKDATVITNPATSVGLTSGPASLDYKPEFKGVEIEQAYGEVAPRVTKESVTLKFKCAESTYDKLQVALQTGTLDFDDNVAGIVPDSNTLYVGGLTFFDAQAIALVSNIGSYFDSGSMTTIDLYEWLLLYNAMSVSGLKLDWKRGETRMVEVEVTGYADVTRNEGDQLFQIGQLSTPA
jgi:hypothetical protein